MKHKEASLWGLYFSFLKIGGLTFGGGYAMLPMLQREVITKHNWVTEEEVLDIYAIGQCTPGIIAVNTATMIGYKKRGVLGAIAATFGEVTPSLVVITLLATLLLKVQDSVYVQQAFAGIRIAVCALITQAIVTLAKKSLVSVSTVLFFLATVAAMVVLPISPIPVVAVVLLVALGKQWLKGRKA